MNRLARLLALLCGVLAAAPGVHATCPESGGIGGTGITADGGIGGTGAPAPSELGIIGVINAFGSICVNGVEIDYDAGTPVSANNAAVGASALALGQTVAVRAVGNDLHARATRIDILEGVIGRVSAREANGTIRIGPQRVSVDARTVFAGTTRAALAPGQGVRVSGLWRADGTLAATRIEAASAREAPRVGSANWPDLGARRYVVEGYVRSVDGARIDIGGLQFERSSGAAAPKPGELVRLTARVEGTRRVLERALPLRPASDARPQGGGADAAREAPERDDETRGNRGPGGGGPDPVDKGATPERGGGNSGPDRLQPPERPERSGPDRPERPDRGGPDRPTRPERPERPDRSGPGRGG